MEARTFHIHRFELRRRGQPSLTVDDLSAQIQWQRGLLKLKEITLRAPSGLVTGTMEVDFMRPNLRLDLKGTLPNETGGVDTLLLKLQMASKKDSETIGGAFSLVGQSGSAERLRCEGDLSLEKQGIFFHRLRLSQPGREVTVTGEGEILLTEGRSYLRVWGMVHLPSTSYTCTGSEDNIDLGTAPNRWGENCKKIEIMTDCKEFTPRRRR